MFGVGLGAMPLDHMLDEAFGEMGVEWGGVGRLAVLQHDVIHGGERGDEFGPRALGQQGVIGVGDFDHQRAAGLARLAQEFDMFGEERVKVAGDPLCGLMVEPLAEFVERDDFRSGIQKQSLTAACGIANGGAGGGC